MPSAVSNAQILAAIEAANLPELSRNLAVTISRLDALCERVDNHEEALNGNGKPGIKVTVSQIVKDMGLFKKISGVLGTVIIALLGYIIQMHLK